MTPTPDQLTDQLTDALTEEADAQGLTGAYYAPHLAAAITPLVQGLLADARTEGFRHGYTAGRTLTRQAMP